MGIAQTSGAGRRVRRVSIIYSIYFMGGYMIRRKLHRLVSLLTAVTMAAAVVLASAGTLHAEAAATDAAATDSLTAALISGDQVIVTGSISTLSEDGILHLYAQETYESGTEGTEVAQTVNGGTTWTFALNYNTANSMLNKKFTVVVLQNGVLTAVGNSVYITNPEAVATHTSTRMDNGIKGILPAAELINENYLSDLGVQQATYNLLLGRIVSNASGGDTIAYTYNGKTYYFDKLYVAEYDIIAQRLNAQGIQVTFIVLNELASNTTLIHPMATIANTTGTAENYYALNAATEAGVELLEAVMSFLAARYSGTEGYGQVDNWIIGNEVNAYTQWNYMYSPSIEYYTQEYANAFRICYNSIKSQNANANVYVATDQQWAEPSNAAIYYGSKDFLTTFNTIIKAEGNIDWRVSSHPYNVPLYDVNNWTDSGYATHSQDSRYVTIQNIDVLTDFLCQEDFLSPTGEVRTVKISEVGYTSLESMGSNEYYQAAAITYAYLQAISNQYIDGIIINRQLDATAEIAQGLAYGLMNTDGSLKVSYDFYKNLGDLDYINTASAIVGVDLLSRCTFR